MDKQFARYMACGKEVKYTATQETYKLVENMDADRDTVKCVNMPNLGRYELLTAWVKNWEQNSIGFRERFTENIEDCKTERAAYEVTLPIANITPNNEIRFIGSDYHQKFKIADLGMVSLNGQARQVAYLDDYHFAFVDTGTAYHHFQFAELCEQGDNQIAPVTPFITPLHEKSEHVKVDGHTGTWYVIDTADIDGEKYYLLESEQHGDEAANLCLDKTSALILDDVYNGFDDLQDFLQNQMDDELEP